MSESNTSRNIVAADANTNVLVRAKPGVLSQIVVAKLSAHVVTLYDSADATTPAAADLICTFAASTPVAAYRFDRVLKKGLVATVAASFVGDWAIMHRAG